MAIIYTINYIKMKSNKFMVVIIAIGMLYSCDKVSKDVLFFNVDTQVDFMRADGKLYVEGAEAIEDNLAKLTKLAKNKNIRVINTCDYHTDKSEELSEKPDFINTFPKHCMANTKGQDFIEATKPEKAIIFDWNKKYDVTKEMLNQKDARNIIIRKDLFDVFAGNPNTDNIIKAIAPKKIFVYGVTTNVCVHFAVIGLADRGYEVYVLEDAIKELPKIPIPFEQWKKKGVKFIKYKDIEKFL